MIGHYNKNARPVEESSVFHKLTNNKKYYLKYLKGLEDFKNCKEVTLTVLEYYKIDKEIEKIKEHIQKIR